TIARIGDVGSGSRKDATLSSPTPTRTTTQITFNVNAASSSAWDRFTWGNVRVRPTAGTPLATGKLFFTGTTIFGVNSNSSAGTLREVAGAATNLVIQLQPSATATAGVPFGQQPAIEVRDRFGTLRSAANGVSDNSTVVTAARSAGNGTLA